MTYSTNRSTSRSIAAFASILIALNSAQADHGPGTSGGGVLTQSGETLKPGSFAAEVREDYTQFESLSQEQIESKAARAGSFDLLQRSFIHSISLAYGIVENFQIGMSIGYYQASKAREAGYDSGTGDTEISTFNPDGLTDLWLTSKYRFYRGPIGNFAVIGGVKFPTGEDKVFNSAGERIEPSATAGSGSYDGMLGLAYSRFLTARVTLDTSAQYTIRTEANDFQLGDRIDAGLAFAYRFTEDINHFPQWTAFAETNLRYLLKSKDGGERDPNTGGTVLFVTPGIRALLNKNLAVTISSPIPTWQNLNGEQLKTSYKINAGVTISF